MIFAYFLLGLLPVSVVLFYLTSLNVKEIQDEKVFLNSDAPVLMSGQKIKIMTWNAQFFAGKQNCFFFDTEDYSGPDAGVDRKCVMRTMKDFARIIKDENPDILLLQEVEYRSRRSAYVDELQELLKLLPKEYCCHTFCYYVKFLFHPHPKLPGPVSIRLAVISKYKINKAVRYQLPYVYQNPIRQQFYFKRAIFAAHMPVEGGSDFVAINTHLDAFTKGTDIMKRQVGKIKEVLEDYSDNGNSWLIGGDFNLIPSVNVSKDIEPENRWSINVKKSEIKTLFKNYQSSPNLKELEGSKRKSFYTYFSNDLKVKKPDRTLDYLFYSDDIKIDKYYVRQKDTMEISDHFPLIAEIEIP